MNLRRWIAALYSSIVRAQKPTPHRNQCRPVLERLEDRLPPAAGLASGNQQLLSAYGQLPLSFEANEGQTAAQVQYFTHTGGGTLFLTSSSAVLSLTKPVGQTFLSANPLGQIGMSAPPNTTTTGVALAINLIGANPNAAVVGLDQLPGISNYFIGNVPSQWHTNIANYSKVEYENVYPGINLIYYGNQQQLEYDYQLAPDADPSSIRFAVHGAESLSIDAKGNLVLHTAIGDVLEQAPVIYQQLAGTQQPVSGQFVLLGNNEVGFQVGAYDGSKPLVIDPVLSYSTYLGGNHTETGQGIAVDGSGNAYVTGYTDSTNFPTTTGAFQTSTTNGGTTYDSFVTKLNPSGTGLVYSTYLGGTGSDFGLGIALDGSGDAYITGQTGSTNFPTTSGAFQTTYAGGGAAAFVTKLNATGTALIYSTYLRAVSSGGSPVVGSAAIAVDGSGNAYVTGFTYSTNFPTTSGAFQTTLGGVDDAFVTKLNATGTALIYSTYLGGSDEDFGYGLAVDSTGHAYVTGGTRSTNFATTTGAFQTTFGGYRDAFVAKLNAGGTGLVYSTYLGGNGDDIGNGIALDNSGDAYVTGDTSSTNFPTTTGAFQTSLAGGVSTDAFVTKLNGAATALVYSTYLGGSGSDNGYGIAVDSAGYACVTGSTGLGASSVFPITTGAFQTTFGGSYYDAFVAKLNLSGTGLVYSTYLGGSGTDEAYGIALDSLGNAYLTGYTTSTNFPTTSGAFQTSHASDTNSGGAIDKDAFVTKFTFVFATTTTLTDNGPNPSTFGQAVSFTATVSGGSAISGETVYIEDADNANAVVASPTLGSGGTVTFTISNLTVGTHHLFAVYNGDATHAGSNSSATPVTQIVNEPAPVVASVIINGGAPAYTDSLGNNRSLVGQNSVVEQILVTFNEAVTLGPNAFSITNNAAGVTVNSGAAPNALPVTAVWGAPVAGSGNTQWIVTFTGPGTTSIPGGVGNVIKDGLYILNINATDVTALVGGLPMASNVSTGFWAMYGAVHDNVLSPTIGDGNSEVFLDGNDFIEFARAFNSLEDSSGLSYDVAMDVDLDGYYDGETFTDFATPFNSLKDWAF